jgi:hypothetical protein
MQTIVTIMKYVKKFESVCLMILSLLLSSSSTGPNSLAIINKTIMIKLEIQI